MTPAGEIRGVPVDVGGMLGLFSQTVMISFGDLQFHPDPESEGFAVFVAMTPEALEALPEWDESQLDSAIGGQRMPGDAG